MSNDIIYHQQYGRLDLRQPDLGLPKVERLWESLLEDRRRPIRLRGLTCGEICRDMGHVEWMHIYERGGQRIAAHERSEAERRHSESESDEHKAYKERTVRAAEAGGHRAEAEKRSADGKVRTDVLVYGVGDMPHGWEHQRSRISTKTVLRRTKDALSNSVLATWHTDRRDLATRNEVPWTRTDQLPAERIRKDRLLMVRGGVQHMIWERCDYRNPQPCPKLRTGRCGGLHPRTQPVEVDFDALVRHIAEARYVPIEFKASRHTLRFWVPAADRDRYENDLGHSARPTAPRPRPPSSTTSGGAPTCRPGHRQQPLSTQEGCNWSQCGRPGRPFPCGIRCPDHTPAALAGRPEVPPGPGWPGDRNRP